jgi:hypothetical protein
MIAAACLSVAVSACGSSAATAAWKTPSEAIGALDQAGLTCAATGQPKIRTADGQPGFTGISCDGYDIVLVTDAAKFDAYEKSRCAGLDNAFWATAANSTMVVAPTFLVFSNADDTSFPAAAQPAAFVKAFGGEEKAASQYYGNLCGLSEAQVRAKASNDTGGTFVAMEGDLRAAAAAMEVYFTAKGTYPTSLADLQGFAASKGNEVVIGRTDATSFCLEVSNPGAPDNPAHFESSTARVIPGTCPKA